MLDRCASSVQVRGATEARSLQAYPTTGVVQATQACPNNRHQVYYEVNILSVGESGIVAVGFASTDYPMNRLVGWDKTSYGYHSDDGKSFVSTSTGSSYGPTFTTGDVIGAGIDLGRRKVFFTKNGVRLKTAARNVSACVVPSVGFKSKGAAVRFDFSGPFRYKAEASSDEEGLEASYWRAHIDRQHARLTHSLGDQVTKLKQQLAQISLDEAGLDQMTLDEMKQAEARHEHAAKKMREAAVARSIAQERKALADEKLCSLCCERPKGLVFNCGHQTCEVCGSETKMPVCPFDRKPINTRIRLFST